MTGKNTILIVDDEKNVLKAMKRTLISGGYRVFTTNNPQEAIQILKSREIDVIISDQRMPTMPGLTLLNLAKDISPETKRILISGYSDHLQPEEFINFGEISSYISKPWLDEELKLLINSTLEMKYLEEKNRALLKTIKIQNLELERANTLLTANIKSKRKQIQFFQNIIETSKLQLKTINEFLYIINSSNSIKVTFTSLFSTICNIIKFEEIGAVYISNPSENPPNFHILNVMENERALVRPMHESSIGPIRDLFMKHFRMLLIQNFGRSRHNSYFSDCFLNHDIKQVIVLPLFNRDENKRQFMGFIFLGSRKTTFFQSSKISLFTELLMVLANTVSEMIVFEHIKQGGTQWEMTFDAIQDPLILVNGQYIILRANHAAMRLSRTQIKNLIGKNCYKLFAGSEKPCESCPILSKNTSGLFVDHENNRFYNARMFPIGDNFLIYYRDTTDTRHLHYKLIQSDKMAAIGELAGQIAHEINNPLAGLLAFTQLLLKEIKKESPYFKYIPDLKEIETAALRCKDIIENLLSFSNTNQMAFFKKVNINDVIEKTLPLIKYSLKVNKICLKKKYEKNILPVNGNFNQLQQVVFNLITNACHAMTGGGILTIQTETLKGKGQICLSIHDTGSGIPLASLQKIFDPFYTTKDESIGTGLGLYICHEIISKHSGTISVDSTVDRQTIFKVFLPFASEKNLNADGSPYSEGPPSLKRNIR